MDVCRLFPQHVPVVIPLIEGVPMRWQMPCPGVLGGGGGGLGTPLEHAMAAEAACNHSWSSGRQSWGPVTTPGVREGSTGVPQPLL